MIHPLYKSFNKNLLLWSGPQFPGDKPVLTGEPATQSMVSAENKRENSQSEKAMVEDDQNHTVSPTANLDANAERAIKMDAGMFDLNLQPHRLHGHTSNNQAG